MEDSLRRRLEALNRGPIPAGNGVRIGAHDHSESHSPLVAEATRPHVTKRRSELAEISSAVKLAPCAGLLRSGEVVETPSGEHLRICVPLDQLWQNGSRLVGARQDFLQMQLTSARDAIEPTVVIEAEFASLVSALPDRFLALDLETCGLSGAALFLVGLLRQVGGRTVVELLLARNYAEEAAVLQSLWRIVEEHDVLVTFNGKTFDWPMVLERSVRHRLARPHHRQLLHIDVLHHARRKWRKRLPNCRLQTLEWHVCRRRREADIPGHQIPAVYADYVRTGFEREMDMVLHHNALDLVTLFDLALRLAA